MSHREGRHEQHIHHSGSRGRFLPTEKRCLFLSMLRLYRLLYRPRLNYMSTHLISPHKVFNNPLPSPPQWSKQIPVLSDSNLAAVKKLFGCFGTRLKNFRILFLPAQWKECNDDKRRLDRTLDRFASTLRSVHRRKINWPKNESFPNEWAYPAIWSSSSDRFHRLSPKQYMESLLISILHLYHQSHSESTLQRSRTLESRDIDVDGSEF